MLEVGFGGTPLLVFLVSFLAEIKKSFKVKPLFPLIIPVGQQ